MIKDFKGRLYTILETIGNSVLLECQDGSRVRLRAHGWEELGFIRA